MIIEINDEEQEFLKRVCERSLMLVELGIPSIANKDDIKKCNELLEKLSGKKE